MFKLYMGQAFGRKEPMKDLMDIKNQNGFNANSFWFFRIELI